MKPWQILHLDLNAVFPDLPAQNDYGGLYLVFWWQNVPLGRAILQPEQLPISSGALRDLALRTVAPVVRDRLNTSILDDDILSQLSATLALPDEMPSVSVVVCTRDRPDDLVECLRSLSTLDPPPQEIIVVDNAPSSDATKDLVATFPQIRYVCETQPGLSAARNAGIRHSKGAIVAFTDDDVRVHPQWIGRLAGAFRSSEVMSVTGLVIPNELETESQIIFELGHGCLSGEYLPRRFDREFFAANQADAVPVWIIGAGANMAFRRVIFEKIGDFDERLGAGASGCSEDSEMWYRILAAGWHCDYEPTAVVYHSHRRSRDRLNAQMYQYMRGHITALLIQFDKYQHWGNLRRAFFALPKHYGGLFLGSMLRGSQLKQQTLKAEILGCLAGFSFYLKNR